MIDIGPYYAAWYVRLWRWMRGWFKRKRPFPSDPYFYTIVEAHYFDGPKDPPEAPK